MFLIPEILDILIGGIVDAYLITAVAAGLAGACFLGAIYMILKAIKDIVRAVYGVPDPVVRREFIDAQGRRGVEEIPYQPAMNLLTTAVQHGESMRRLN